MFKTFLIPVVKPINPNTQFHWPSLYPSVSSEINRIISSTQNKYKKIIKWPMKIAHLTSLVKDNLNSEELG